MPSRDIAWLLAPELLTALLIAVAVCALFRVAGAVRDGMGLLAGRTHEPRVTASLEPSEGDRNHVDLVIENCGFVPAFDVQVVAMPEIPTEEGWEDRPAGWHDVSLLRPGQSVTAYACRAERLVDLEMLIEISWKKRPDAKQRTSMQYLLDMRRYAFQVPYASPSARDELLSELRLFRRDWRPLARGERPLRVDLAGTAIEALVRETRTDVPDEGRLADTAGSGEGVREGRLRSREERKSGAAVALSEVR